MNIGIIVAVVVIAVLGMWLAGTFNRLVTLRNRVENAWAQIEVQLKRRYDLVPNLVETVKGYAQHERELFEKVTQARANAINATGVADRAQAENMLTQALRSVFAVAEAYPDLKASANFLALQDQLTQVEDKIAYARQFYNDTVMMFNTALQTFPTNLVAGAFGFGAREFFEVTEEAAREPVKVDFTS
jgi:LemA protein